MKFIMRLRENALYCSFLRAHRFVSSQCVFLLYSFFASHTFMCVFSFSPFAVYSSPSLPFSSRHALAYVLLWNGEKSIIQHSTQKLRHRNKMRFLRMCGSLHASDRREKVTLVSEHHASFTHCSPIVASELSGLLAMLAPTHMICQIKIYN